MKKTTQRKHLTREALLRGWLELGLTPEEAEKLREDRPRTRAECANGPRPCGFVGCRFNLCLDVNPETGSIKINFPNLEPWEIPPQASCALDVADAGPHLLEEIGSIVNVARERARQIEVEAPFHLRRRLEEQGIGAEDVEFGHREQERTSA
jgi:hypothetical protein